MKTSMDRIYRQHAESVYKYLLSLTNDDARSEELTQETFYQAVRSIKKYDGSCSVLTWLCSIAKHQLYAYRRKHREACDISEVELKALDNVEETFFSGEKRIELLQAIHRLPEQTREVVHLRLFGNFSFREIGSITGRNENWARVTYYRGVVKLRGEVSEDDQTD